MVRFRPSLLLFSFSAAASTQICTLSLHDALPISWYISSLIKIWFWSLIRIPYTRILKNSISIYVFFFKMLQIRSEEHTSELQSRENLVCRLLLEKKKTPVLQMGRYDSGVCGSLPR